MRANLIRNVLFGLISMIIPVAASAQQYWSGLGVKSNFNKWRVGFESQYRVNINPYQTLNLFVEPGIGYMLHPSLEFRTSYRHRFLPAEAKSKDRVSSALIWEPIPKERHFVLSTRFLFQHKFLRDFEGKDNFRLRLLAGYDIGSNLPFISFETYHDIEAPRSIIRTRATIGIDIDMTRDLKLSAYYRRDDYSDIEDVVKTPNYIFGLSFLYDIKRKKKVADDEFSSL